MGLSSSAAPGYDGDSGNEQDDQDDPLRPVTGPIAETERAPRQAAEDVVGPEMVPQPPVLTYQVMDLADQLEGEKGGQPPLAVPGLDQPVVDAEKRVGRKGVPEQHAPQRRHEDQQPGAHPERPPFLLLPARAHHDGGLRRDRPAGCRPRSRPCPCRRHRRRPRHQPRRPAAPPQAGPPLPPAPPPGRTAVAGPCSPAGRHLPPCPRGTSRRSQPPRPVPAVCRPRPRPCPRCRRPSRRSRRSAAVPQPLGRPLPPAAAPTQGQRPGCRQGGGHGWPWSRAAARPAAPAVPATGRGAATGRPASACRAGSARPQLACRAPAVPQPGPARVAGLGRRGRLSMGCAGVASAGGGWRGATPDGPHAWAGGNALTGWPPSAAGAPSVAP